MRDTAISKLNQTRPTVIREDPSSAEEEIHRLLIFINAKFSCLVTVDVFRKWKLMVTEYILGKIHGYNTIVCEKKSTSSSE